MRQWKKDGNLYKIAFIEAKLSGVRVMPLFSLLLYGCTKEKQFQFHAL